MTPKAWFTFRPPKNEDLFGYTFGAEKRTRQQFLPQSVSLGMCPDLGPYYDPQSGVRRLLPGERPIADPAQSYLFRMAHVIAAPLVKGRPRSALRETRL